MQNAVRGRRLGLGRVRVPLRVGHARLPPLQRRHPRVILIALRTLAKVLPQGVQEIKVPKHTTRDLLRYSIIHNKYAPRSGQGHGGLIDQRERL